MDLFIKKYFQIRYCYKYKGEIFETCKCGNIKTDHQDFPIKDEIWSLENNTKCRTCDTFGIINFTGYNDIITNHYPHFIRFNCEDAPEIVEVVYKLMILYWNFFKPQLIISVTGGLKRMNFNTNQQKKNFKQSLIEVLKKDKTWIIGGGFNVGIHNLISEAVYEYRSQQANSSNQVKLLGICTWGAILNNKILCNENPTYHFTKKTEKGKVLLDSHCDGFLFCDDGTEKQYDKETNFRLKFEKCVRENDNGNVVQILYEGGSRALESAYNSLKASIPLVLIKNSGRAADVINAILDLKMTSYLEKIKSILSANQSTMNIDEKDIEKFQEILREIYEKYRNQIFVHDLFDKSMKLDRKIVEAVISSIDDNDLEKILKITIKFNCFDIAEKKVFLNADYQSLNQKILHENFKLVLKNNQIEFVKLFLENNFSIEDFLTEEDLNGLYNHSLYVKPSRCGYLLVDFIATTDKNFDSKRKKSKYLLYPVRRIINMMSGNILQNENIHPKPGRQLIRTDEENFEFQSQSFIEVHSKKITPQDLFLWALLTEFTELAIIFWKIGEEHIGSALIASIILNKMEGLIRKRGYSDTSAMLSRASKKFQEMAIAVVTEAHNKRQESTYTLLIRTLKTWNNMTCLQIAISGNLLEFLSQSACDSYIRKIWRGELSPFLPMWKILISIPFSFILIKPLIMPSVNQPTQSERSNESAESQTPEFMYEANSPFKRHYSQSKKKASIPYKDMIKMFYQVPIVKFVIHLISYVLFLLVFIYLNLVELKLNLKIQNRWAEIFIFFYVLGIITEEIRQIIDQERTGSIYKLKAYLSGSWNIYDICGILVYIITFFLRCFLSQDLFIVTRCFYSVTLSMNCLRIMQYYFISPTLGPKVIMIGRMIVDIFFFLSIFSLFIISYGTLAIALQDNRSRAMNLSLITEIFYRPYFQTYGELMLDEFHTNDENITDIDRTIGRMTIICGFAVFLLLTNILLINLLIAMFGHTFNKIQVESHKFFSFIQLQLVEEFLEKPLLPPPFNLLHYLITGIIYCGNRCCHKQTRNQNSLLLQDLPKEENKKFSYFEKLSMESSILELESFNNNNNDNNNKLLDQPL